MRDNKKRTRKTKNKILAIEAAPAAIPPKPKIAAIIAIIRKITVQRNIALYCIVINICVPALLRMIAGKHALQKTVFYIF